MILLNLLPHREAARRRRRELFHLSLGVSALAGLLVRGYEIHHGRTTQHPAMAAAGDVAVPALHGAAGALGWHNAAGNVLGLYLHGRFEDAGVLQALFGGEGAAQVPTLDAVFDRLADCSEAAFAPGVLQALVDPAAGPA